MLLLIWALFYCNFFDTLNLSVFSLFDIISVSESFSVSKSSQVFLLILILIVFNVYMFKKYYMFLEKNKIYFNFIFYWFVISMVLVLYSHNMIMMIISWDMLGVSSYLLIVFYGNPNCYNSGFVTMNTNRFGDVFLLIFVCLAFSTNMIKLDMKWGFLSMFIVVCLMTKSAQFPFSSWLPLAMAAPTPVSSLVHSSTLVTAGLFIFYKLDLPIMSSIMFIIFSLSLWTSLFSGLMANVEMDMKKMIALSTLSQISFMFIAYSLGLIFLSFLHLLTHAIFKASLFFWAGVNMHNLKSEQLFNFFNMKGMKMSQSFFFLVFLSLVGFPMVLGFYSKDQVLDLLTSSFSGLANLVLVLSVYLTILYTVRFMVKMNLNASNNFCYKLFYFNSIKVMLAFVLFSILMLSNKILNELFFKVCFILVSSGWKTFFFLTLLFFLLGGWKFGINKVKVLTSMLYLAFLTSKNMVGLYFKSYLFALNMFDFGWMDKNVGVALSIFFSSSIKKNNMNNIFLFFFVLMLIVNLVFF